MLGVIQKPEPGRACILRQDEPAFASCAAGPDAANRLPSNLAQVPTSPGRT